MSVEASISPGETQALTAMEEPLTVLSIHTADQGGGAEAVAMSLHDHYRALGHKTAMAVGRKLGNRTDVTLLDNQRESDARVEAWSATYARWKSAPRQRDVRNALRYLLQPYAVLCDHHGLERFDHPGLRRLWNELPSKPDCIHLHSGHGFYLDLPFLMRLSHRIPVIATLHDEWLLTGHCACTLGCERWKHGCGVCPDLQRYPAILKDGSAHNWRRKHRAVQKSLMSLVTPSHWLAKHARQAFPFLSEEAVQVIHNGIDQTVFKIADPQHARAELDLPMEADIVLFIANGARTNPYKDYPTLEAALKKLAAERKSRALLGVVIGDEGASIHASGLEIRFAGYLKDPVRIACWLQAADVYVHASRTDNFPTTILEAMACGKPVVGTRVGGIPEQVDDGETGLLVEPGSVGDMAQALQSILEAPERAKSLGQAGQAKAKRAYDIRKQAARYLELLRKKRAAIRNTRTSEA